MHQKKTIVPLCIGIFGFLLFVVSSLIYCQTFKPSNFHEAFDRHIRFKREVSNANSTEILDLKNVHISNVQQNFSGNYTSDKNNFSTTVSKNEDILNVKSLNEPISEPETTPELSAQPVNTSETVWSTNSTSEPNSEPETTSESKSEPETTSEPKSEPETTSEPEPETTSEPEPETTSEPKSEPETTSEPEPETTSEPEPEPTSEPQPESEPEVSFPEPVPQWDIAMKEYKWGWDFLVYLFGVIFLLLGLYSVYNIVRLWRIEHLLSRNYFVTLNVLVTSQCLLRGLYLVIDAHNRNGTFPVIVNYFLYSTAYPCLTSAFSILFYALLLATRVQVVSTKIQKLSLLIGIIAFHFALSVITSVIVGLFFSAQVLLLVCQFFYVIWGTILFIGYFHIFNKLRLAAMFRNKNSASIYKASFTSKDGKTNNKSVKRKSKNRYTLNTSVKITFAAAIFGLLCVMLEVYGIFGVYRLYIEGHIPEPWPFFSYQFLLRLVEFCMCCLMVYVASQPIMVRRRSSNRTFSTVYGMFKRLFCVPQEDRLIDSEPSSAANSNALVLSDDLDKKHTVVNFDIKNEEKHCPMKKEQSHLVIREGVVRFKAEDDSVTGSEIGTSLPDLIPGTMINAKRNSVSSDTGISNKGYKENAIESVQKLHRSDTEPSENLKRSMDFEKMSVGTFGTDITRPLSSINLTHSLEWEFEQAYERSFIHNSGSTRSLPSDLSACSAGNCNSLLLKDVSPLQNRSNSMFSYEESEAAIYSDSSSEKPLIKKSNESSTDRNIDEDTKL
ncbi:uncharacterized protein LOC127704739 isoform X22 [Mytilus californianus]|uniref:uncharacterized protein LOC127704739 isoform X22 n=1 Tax=Mytilus californianus TaxID=6549 RepID=UPI002246B0FD|nr:uncharacterized protein LOC127704739 isoform X22 [Mytilus californianus]